MKAISLHRDVLVVTSQLLQVNCAVVRHTSAQPAETSNGEAVAAEAFVVDSPVLPEELDLLPSLVEQAGFPRPRGLLATHADWDHLLGPLAFADATLGCAQSTAERLRAEPGAPQRELRAFDEQLHLRRSRPLSLGSVQPLVVPGRCGIGDAELELHPTDGHTVDGMAVWIPWARVLLAGDYLSAIELPALQAGDRVEAYLDTLARLRPLVEAAEHVVPGHGPVLDGARALSVLEQDTTYLRALHERGVQAQLPEGRHSRAQRQLHTENAAVLTG